MNFNPKLDFLTPAQPFHLPVQAVLIPLEYTFSPIVGRFWQWQQIT